MRDRILIVNGSRASRQVLRNMLAGEYETPEAASGEEALGILRASPAGISAVILDIDTPDGDWAETLAAIRGDAGTAQTPVIVSAGQRGGGSEVRALSLGANDFIAKPYDAEVLRYRLRNILEATGSIETLRAEKESLRISEEQFRVAAATGDRVIARYDIKTGVYYSGGKTLFAGGFGDVIENVPQIFVDRGNIARECVAQFLDFYERLRRGEKSVSADIAILADDGEYRWFRSDATTFFDDEGQPLRAVIVYTDITDQREKESVYKRWQQLLRQKAPESYTLFRCNLSKDTSFDSVEGLLLQARFRDSAATFNERTLEYAAQYVHPEDRESYVAALNSDTLLANYYRNRRIEAIDYREAMQDGMVRWLRVTIELVEAPHSSDVEAHLMYEDIDASKTAEMKTKEMAENDPLTGVLNRAAFAQRMNHLIFKNKAAQHTLLMLDIDGFKQLNDASGHTAGDQALIDIARSLRTVLRHGDLLGRLGGDEFVICMTDIPYDAIIEKKARQICSIIRKTYSLEVQISASIGIAVYPRDGEDFDALYRNADAALYSVKAAGKDGFACFGRDIKGGQPVVGDAAGVLPRIPTAPVKRRMLIVDDSIVNRKLLVNIFQNDFIIETAADGNAALARLRHYGPRLSVILLDLVMPGMDGFAVLEKMRASMELRSIPVIIVSEQDERETGLRAIKCGATDYVSKPINAGLIRLRVESAISKAESERLRAQNSYLLLQSGEEAKYRTVLDSTGTVVIEYDWVGSVFTYDPSITRHIAGAYDGRKLWQILLSDMVADAGDVEAMQALVYSVANDRKRADGSMMVKLKTPSGTREWFRMRVFKRLDEFQLSNRMIITYVNVNEEVLADEKLRFQAERDMLTGLYNRTAFFERAAEMLSARQPGYYVMGCFDINNFKVVNDQYGSEKGDDILKQVATIFNAGFAPVGGVVGRITADNFAVLYPASFMTSPALAQIREAASVLDGSLPPISYSIGRYVADDLSLSVSAMYDRASLAQSSVKGRFDTNIAQYDESMREKLLREQEIVNEMKPALSDRQFELWYQPQYNHSSGALIGAEALVRWRHPDRGLIMPGDFIPVFERNGFIYELDKYVWEQACATLRQWLDAGYSALPVSVNVSRYDLFREDLLETITGLIDRYGLGVELLRLEITESAFAESTERIISVVKSLIDHGFTVEIDDFGSGYSSLNTLKDVPAQVLKMDMRFLEANNNSDRGGNILESVVRMAKWLGMSVIAEGVETRDQADYLKSIGCNYVQGFLYAKPLPAEEYEALAKRAGGEEKLLTLETVENLDNNAFWDPRSMDTLIFNTYVGGACIFEWHNERIEILRANEKYAKTIGGEECTVEDALTLVWEDHMDEAAARATREAIERTIESGDDATYEALYFDLFGAEETWLRTTFRAIARTANRWLLYATNENLTAQRKAEQQERETVERMQTVMDNIDSGVTAVVLRGEEIEYLFVNDHYYEMHGYTKEQYEAEVKTAFDLIHPDDCGRVYEEAQKANEIGKTATLEYRVIRRNSAEAWIRIIISTRRFEGVDRPVQFTVYTDISAEKRAEERLRATTEQLHFLNDTAGDLLARPDTAAGINTVLRKVLDYFGAIRSFIYEYDYEAQLCINAYEIYAPGVEQYTDLCESLPLEETWFWRQTFESSDFIRFDMTDEPDEKRRNERETFGRIGIKSMLAVALRVGGRLIGTMGVDDPTRHLDDYNDLKALGDYMAAILTRRDLMARIESDRTNLLNMMNDTPGGFIRMRVLPDGFLLTEYANDTYCRLRGLPADEIVNDSESAISAVHPDDRERVGAAVAEMIDTGKSRNWPCRLLRAGGGSTPVNIFGRVSKNEAGETFINVYVADLSEQEKRELSLRDMMPYLLSAIMKYSNDLVFAKDRDFRYICCSPAFVKFTRQKSESDVIGRTDYDFWTKEEADHFRGDDMRLFELGEPLIDYIEPIPSDDGIQHYCSTSKYILRDSTGEVIGMYGIGRDITAERSMLEQIRLLTDSIPGGLASYEASPEGVRIIYFSDGFCGTMGYSREEYERISANGVTSITFEEDRPVLKAQLDALIRDDTPLNHCFRIHRKDGGLVWVKLRSGITERRGDRCRFNVVLFDVTEAKLAEEAARVHEKEM